MAASPTAAAIVAGGRARRLAGADKSRLVVEGRSIIARQIDALQQVADSLFVVANDPDRFVDLGLAVVPDRVSDAGALGGLYTAVVSSPAPYVLVVACDLPFLDPGLLARLADAGRQGDGAWIRTAQGVEPLLACYRRDAAPRIRAQIDAGRVRAGAIGDVLDLVTLGPEEVRAYGDPTRLLANINTPEDYARVQYGLA
jgi:molybdopterin-guanine dinucleotide biosynthesis protein A